MCMYERTPRQGVTNFGTGSLTTTRESIADATDCGADIGACVGAWIGAWSAAPGSGRPAHDTCVHAAAAVAAISSTYTPDLQTNTRCRSRAPNECRWRTRRPAVRPRTVRLCAAVRSLHLRPAPSPRPGRRPLQPYDPTYVVPLAYLHGAAYIPCR
jgi:hypothetical protein